MRTQAEIRAQLLRISPWWLREPEPVTDAILMGIAAAFERVEGAIERLFDRTMIDEADASWLDQHGLERARFRSRPLEPDETYRPRIKGWPDAVTKPAILAAVDAVLVVGTARMEEWLPDGPFACDTGSVDASGFAGVFAYAGRRGFTIYIERQAESTNDTAWSVPAGAGSIESFTVLDTGDGHYDEDPGSFSDRSNLEPSAVYGRVIDVINQTKAAGVAYRVVVE